MGAHIGGWMALRQVGVFVCVCLCVPAQRGAPACWRVEAVGEAVRTCGASPNLRCLPPCPPAHQTPSHSPTPLPTHPHPSPLTHTPSHSPTPLPTHPPRGTTDNKGPVLAFVYAVRELLEECKAPGGGCLPVNVAFIFEGGWVGGWLGGGVAGWGGSLPPPPPSQPSPPPTPNPTRALHAPPEPPPAPTPTPRGGGEWEHWLPRGCDRQQALV